MKKIVIVHEWNGGISSHWYPWLKQELSLLGYDVVVPEIENPDEPVISAWVNRLYDLDLKPNETYFVGHSIGCQAIMRYLDTLDGTTKIGGAIFVAPWFTLKNLEDDDARAIAKPWLTELLDTEKIKQMGEFFAFFTKTDQFVDIENVKLFEDRLGAGTFVFEEGGHLTEEDGVKEIPEVLEKITQMLQK